MNISLLQMRVEETPDANIEKVNRLTADISSQIVVLPELFTSGFNYEHINELPEDHHQILESLNSGKTYVGSVVRMAETGTKRYNSFFIKTDEDIVFPYDKWHLFPLMDEDYYFKAGNRLGMFEFDNISCAASVCFDLRFPELFRKYFTEGAKVVFLPAEWPKVRKDHLVALTKARAIENQCYMVMCNAVGDIWGTAFGGASMIVDPWGEVVLDCEEAVDVVKSIHLDLSVVNDIRNRIPIAGFRREDLYGD